MKRFVVWLTVNRQCNLACRWCYQGQLLKSSERMSLDLAEKLIQLTRQVGAQKFIMLGGEPTIHPSFFEIAKLASGVGVSVLTNALAFAELDFCKRAEDAGISLVSTSLKGATEEEYEEGCGKRALSRVMRAIRNLEQSSIPHQVSITVCRSTIDHWDGILRFIRESGARQFTFSFERPVMIGERVEFDDRSLPGNIVRFIEDTMYPSLKDTGVAFDLNLTFPQCHFSEGFVKRAHAEGHAVAGCQLLMDNGIVFDPNGNVLACNHMVDHPLGGYGKDFSTASEFTDWRNSRDIRRFYSVASAPPGEQCSDCESWSACGAGCRVYWLYKGQEALIPADSIRRRRPSHGE